MNLTLNLRTRVEAFRGSGEWEEVVAQKEFAPGGTALLLCDLWDNHWCPSAARRCEGIAHKLAPVVEALRARGVAIIHAPSDCMEFYQDTPARKRMLAVPRVAPPPLRDLTEPPLPIDDSDGGCDDDPAPEMKRAWTRQHPAVRIMDEDGISDNGDEVYSLLRQRNIQVLLIAGVPMI